MSKRLGSFDLSVDPRRRRVSYYTPGPGQKRRWAKGVEGCPECKGDGRVRRIPLKKDGTPKKLGRWETCGCVGPKPLVTSAPQGRRRAGHEHTAVILHGAPLEEPVTLPEGVERPRRRGDCQGGLRPCPWVGCRYHLYLEVVNQGTAVRLPRGLNVPPEALVGSCALDEADQGEMTLEAVAELLGVTRERVRQVENVAMYKLKKRLPEGHPLREACETLSDARDYSEGGQAWPRKIR